MDSEGVTRTIKSACNQVGISEAAAQRLADQLLDSELAGQVRQIQEENQRLKADLARYEKVHDEMVMLLKAKSPNHLVHDLRNVLNELALLKAVAGEL